MFVNYYRNQGVKYFNDNPVLKDAKAMAKYGMANPECFVFLPYIEDTFGDDIPEICGLGLPLMPGLLLNTAKAAEEVFINKNKYNTKDPTSARSYSILMKGTIVF